MKKALCMLLALIFMVGAVPALADEAVSGKYWDVTWEYKDNVLTFYSTDEVPSYTRGLMVNYKYNYPWKDVADDVHKVVFDEGIPKIDTHIFRDMRFVKEIVIPSTLTEIEERLLSLNQLDNIVVRLESIVVDENNPVYSSSDGVLFDKEKSRLIKYPRMKEGTAYTIPDSVKVIGENAFYSCNLSEIAFGNGLTDIEKQGFYESKALKRIALPESLDAIGDEAFGKCSALEEAVLGNNVTHIGESAFSSCGSLKKSEFTQIAYRCRRIRICQFSHRKH